MYIEPGTSIISGVHSPHECAEKEYKYVKIRGMLVSPHGKIIEYNMLQCNKCGTIAMRGDKVHEIENMYRNYRFVHVPKKKLVDHQARSKLGIWNTLINVQLQMHRGYRDLEKKANRKNQT